MALVLQEVLTLPVHLSPPPGFAEFVLLKIFGFDFVDIVIVLCIFSLSNCIVYSFSIYNCWGGVQLPYDHDHDGLLMNKIH